MLWNAFLLVSVKHLLFLINVTEIESVRDSIFVEIIARISSCAATIALQN